MSESAHSSKSVANPAASKKDTGNATNDTANATSGMSAPTSVAEGTVTVTDQSRQPSMGDISPPPADATHVYISLTFTSIEKDTAQTLIDAARSVVGRDKSFSVSFGEAIN
jgi:hypothetical protein